MPHVVEAELVFCLSDCLAPIHVEELQNYGATSLSMPREKNDTCQGICSKSVTSNKQELFHTEKYLYISKLLGKYKTNGNDELVSLLAASNKLFD